MREFIEASGKGTGAFLGACAGIVVAFLAVMVIYGSDFYTDPGRTAEAQKFLLVWVGAFITVCAGIGYSIEADIKRAAERRRDESLRHLPSQLQKCPACPLGLLKANEKAHAVLQCSNCHATFLRTPAGGLQRFGDKTT